MAVTVDSFLVEYPEFEPAGEELIEAKLAAAALEVDAEVWRSKASQGIALLTAHWLATSPNGEFARLVNKEGDTIYQKRFNEIRTQVSYGYRLI